MKKVLRHRLTKQYLTAAGTWAEDFKLAREFADIRDAVRLRNQLRLPDAELVYVHADWPSERDVVIRLGPPDSTFF